MMLTSLTEELKRQQWYLHVILEALKYHLG
jgi:hypothetical protein